MNTLVATAGAAALVLTSLVARPADAQSVDELIGRHLEARGGYDRIKAVRTYRIARTVATPFSNIKVVTYKKRPGLYRSEQTPPNQPTTVRAFNLESAWTDAGGKIGPILPAVEKEQREIDTDFDGILVDYKEKGHAVEPIGREKLAGADVYKLKVTLKSGAIRYVYLDAQTLLERKQVGTMTSPQGKPLNVEITYSDYRDVDGLKIPFAIDDERDAPGQTFAIYIDKVELNVPIDDSMFSQPR